MGFEKFEERIAVQAVVAFSNVQGVTSQSFYNGIDKVGRIDKWLWTNNDTIDHVVNVLFYQTFITHQIGSFNVPAGTGFGGVAALDAIPLLTGIIDPYLIIGPNCELRAAMSVAIAATKTVEGIALGGQF